METGRIFDIPTDYLSLENTNCLRGFFSIAVLLCHLREYIPFVSRNPDLLYIFNAMGYLSVGFFFFLSGYGMTLSYLEKGIKYARNIFRKRTIPFYFVSLGFAALDCFFTDRSLQGALSLFYSFGKTGFLWYLEVQFLIYVLFGVIFSQRWSDRLKTVAFFSSVLLLMCVADFLMLGKWWIISTECIFVGVLWAFLKDEIDCFFCVRRNVLATILISFVMFHLFFHSVSYLANNTVVLTTALSATFFVVFTMSISAIKPLNNLVFKFLGSISLEIYALQHLIMSFFHAQWMSLFCGINIVNPWIYSCVVFVSTIAASVLIHPIVAKFMSLRIWKAKM